MLFYRWGRLFNMSEKRIFDHKRTRFVSKCEELEQTMPKIGETVPCSTPIWKVQVAGACIHALRLQASWAIIEGGCASGTICYQLRLSWGTLSAPYCCQHLSREVRVWGARVLNKLHFQVMFYSLLNNNYTLLTDTRFCVRLMQLWYC